MRPSLKRALNPLQHEGDFARLIRRKNAVQHRPTNGYDGLVGRLLALDDAGRASVLVELFNRAMVTKVDAAPLQLGAAE